MEMGQTDSSSLHNKTRLIEVVLVTWYLVIVVGQKWLWCATVYPDGEIVWYRLSDEPESGFGLYGGIWE